MARMGDTRITLETLAYGQARAYADHVKHVRLTFERIPYAVKQDGGVPDWVPDGFYNDGLDGAEAEAYSRVKALAKLLVGWSNEKQPGVSSSMDEYFSPTLHWIKEVAPAVWEVYVATPYCD